VIAVSDLEFARSHFKLGEGFFIATLEGFLCTTTMAFYDLLYGKYAWEKIVALLAPEEYCCFKHHG
jgi:hypothetical protein